MIRIFSLFLLATTPALGLELTVPGELTHHGSEVLGVHEVATGPARDRVIPTTSHEGPITRLIWELEAMPSALALFNALNNQLEDDGFEAAFTCSTRACGGFDFRFGIEVVQAPDMFLDLSDFHYLSAHRDDGSLSLLVSRSGVRGYVQLILVGGPDPVIDDPEVTLSTRSLPPVSLAQTLDTYGVVILNGVDFAPGKVELTSDDIPSLTQLATYLADHPNRSIALVGHTDTEGSLEGNQAVSRQRAEAVRRILIEDLGVSPDQIEAQGIGFLAPRASNLTDTGRAKNRRVEAVLTSTR